MNDDEQPAVYTPDGWISMRGPGGEGGVHARVESKDGRKVVTELYVHAAEINANHLRAIPIGRIDAAANSSSTLDWLLSLGHRHKTKTMAELRECTPAGGLPPPVKREPLTRPHGIDPDEFSRRVATAYNSAVVTSSKPAKLLADEAGVPVGTVHRWIREARQRGHLPPARQGRAG